MSIAEAYPEVYFAVGVHPQHAMEEKNCSVEDLLAIASHPKMVGIGETGLDYHYTVATASEQMQLFLVHIEAARRSGLPLIVHSRDADEDMIATLHAEYTRGHFSCVMHCYSSGERLAQAACSMGFYVSMSGIVTFRNAAELRRIFSTVPADQLLIETDAPYLAPVPRRGKRNEPAFVRHVAEAGAELLGLDYASFAALSTRNFLRLFRRVDGFDAGPAS